MRRGRLLCLLLLLLSVGSAATSAPAPNEAGGPRLDELRVSSGLRFAGDRPLLATVSPNGDGVRDRAVVRFRLRSAATVALHVLVCRKHPTTVLSKNERFGAGNRSLRGAKTRCAPREICDLQAGR